MKVKSLFGVMSAYLLSLVEIIFFLLAETGVITVGVPFYWLCFIEVIFIVGFRGVLSLFSLFEWHFLNALDYILNY